jgi:putative oxidoreductase
MLICDEENSGLIENFYNGKVVYVKTKMKGEINMKYTVLIGRIFFAIIFIQTLPGHLSPDGVGYAAGAGVPFPTIIVPLSGFIALLGGLSIAFGYKAKFGAWLIVLFLVPVSLFMHNFWAITDPAMYEIQKSAFLKNLSMIGGALLITYFGAGPLSLDSFINRAFRVRSVSGERVKTSPRLTRSQDKGTEKLGIRQSKEKEKEEKK